MVAAANKPEVKLWWARAAANRVPPVVLPLAAPLMQAVIWVAPAPLRQQAMPAATLRPRVAPQTTAVPPPAPQQLAALPLAPRAAQPEGCQQRAVRPALLVAAVTSAVPQAPRPRALPVAVVTSAVPPMPAAPRSATGGSSHVGGTASAGGTTSASTGVGGSSQAGTSSTQCASRVLSLSANGTGSDSDAAYAHVEADLKTDLPIGNAARTVEYWAYIKTTDWVGDKNEMYFYGGSANAGSFGMDFGTNPVSGSTTNHATLDPFTGGGFNDDSTDNLGINSSSDQWVHIAMTWDQTALRTYVNGLLKITTNGSSGTTALATAQSVLTIGCNPQNNACFNGDFSEFRVWSVTRSDAQIKAGYNQRLVGDETGLVGYWRFDDAAGSTTAADSVSATGHTAHPGTLKADTTAHNPTFVAPAAPVPITCP